MGQAGLSHHLTLARNMPKATAHVTFWAVASHMALQVASENAYKGIINSHESLQVLIFIHGRLQGRYSSMVAKISHPQNTSISKLRNA